MALIVWITNGALVVLVSLLAFRVGGWELISAGLRKSGGMFRAFSLLFLVIILIAGQSHVLMERHMELIKAWVTGGRGLVTAWVSAFAIPGGGMVALYPELHTLWEQGIGRTTILLFLVAAPLINWQYLLFRVMFLGWKVSFMAYVFEFLISFFILGFFLVYERWLH